ncbi:MAG TPA: toxic anion resistance protein [Accumulibacter sp.]|nr:toxic anion resistance protein [Accumulibacter sp.]
MPASSGMPAEDASFVLTPPEPLTPLGDQQASRAIPLPDQLMSAVDQQVDRFISALLHEGVHSDAFKSRLDSAFRLGREEISCAASLMSGRFMSQNMRGIEDSSAFKAVQAMRHQLDQLDPGREGDLLTQNKLLGILPYGDKLKAYFRRFQSAAGQIQSVLQQLYVARDDLQRDVVDIEASRSKLWEALQKLKAAARFAEQLDSRLARQVATMRASDEQRARALEQEVLYYARQNLQDLLTQQAVCVNGYLSLEVLKKTCREMIIGCERVATTGMSALAVAQTVARATGNQIKVANMLGSVNQSIENMIVESGKQLGAHAERSVQLTSNPLLGVEKLQEMFDLTFQAVDVMDNFRSKAIESMSQTNALLREQVQRAELRMDRSRQEQVRAQAATMPDGPVKL